MTHQQQQQLGKTLWAIADDLRGSMNADDFRDYMLAFLFLGYVLNVIECPRERQQVLAEAWNLATRMLVVAARVNVEGRGYSTIEFGDGIVTGMGTFQKSYTQAELKQYLESQL